MSDAAPHPSALFDYASELDAISPEEFSQMMGGDLRSDGSITMPWVAYSEVARKLKDVFKPWKIWEPRPGIGRVDAIGPKGWTESWINKASLDQVRNVLCVLHHRERIVDGLHASAHSSGLLSNTVRRIAIILSSSGREELGAALDPAEPI